ncbi:PTS mannose transporter subunit IIAB [Enterococcus casseliflavus]|nr:PTS mannose transporter subunit IIAB [Enterococcus casseliflavus]
MTIVNVRIDSRLIHGQVATMWTNSLKANRILVANDDVANDSIQKMALKMAVPSGVALSVLSVDKASQNIVDGKYDKQKLFIIIKNPTDGLRLVENGVDLKEINFGNMSHKEGNLRITKTVSLNEDDILAIKKLSSLNVNLISKMVPNDSAEKVLDLLKKNEGK